ncbi:hypothetical protein [Pandoraea anhela]|uniref:Uncharacterized protein n=1 Tax=Pandoraea anhela TaxID=2508295 RepID=A0A5E4YJW5_9BURK|nr:hypothetical protein [Pandoraea anhela]VVE48568.1 hypothetical protein PAN31108_04557 [Pandoraea anhela]
MRLPFALAALDWIAPRDVHGARTLLDLGGKRGWTCRAVGGYCVATAVELPRRQASPAQPLTTEPLIAALAADDTGDASLVRWLARISLVLAGQTELRDDSLCIANETVWWVHRFDTDICAAQVEVQLRRQLLACEMLSSQGAEASGTMAASTTPTADHTRMANNAGAAGTARPPHSLRHG